MWPKSLTPVSWQRTAIPDSTRRGEEKPRFTTRVVRRLARAFGSSQDELDLLRAEHGALVTECNRLRESERQLAEEFRQISDDVLRQVERHDKEVADLRERLAEREAEVAKRNATISEYETRLSELQKQLDAWRRAKSIMGAQTQ